MECGPAGGRQPVPEIVQHPELAGLLPVLYPKVFPKLAALTASRADLVAILLTGLPSGIVTGFQNYTGPQYADELRLNLAIPPPRRIRTRSDSSAEMRRDSRTDAGSSTTSSPSSCGRSPGRRIRWSPRLQARRRGDGDHGRARPDEHPSSCPSSPISGRRRADIRPLRWPPCDRGVTAMSTTATNGSTPETGVPLDQAASASVAIDVGVGSRGAGDLSGRALPRARDRDQPRGRPRSPSPHRCPCTRERMPELSSRRSSAASLRASTSSGRTPARPDRR